jgi:hypothetical protein
MPSSSKEAKSLQTYAIYYSLKPWHAAGLRGCDVFSWLGKNYSLSQGALGNASGHWELTLKACRADREKESMDGGAVHFSFADSLLSFQDKSCSLIWIAHDVA